MRFLSNSEIEEWASKINHNILSTPFQIQNTFITNDLIRKSIDYRFSFSISKNNIYRFEKLLGRFLSEGFKQTMFENGKEYIQNLSADDFLQLIKIEQREEHRTYGVDFIKFTYNFTKVPPLPCILYIQTIKDVIKIIGDFYGFEDGIEICSIKHSIGSVVSLKHDRSEYFIESLEFIRENTSNYLDYKKIYDFSEELILYKLLKIINNINSQVLEFSDGYVLATSTNIIPNRGQRLDELLGE